MHLAMPLVNSDVRQTFRSVIVVEVIQTFRNVIVAEVVLLDINFGGFQTVPRRIWGYAGDF